MVARLQQGLHRKEYPFFGRHHQGILHIQAFVQAGNGFPQKGMSRTFGIPQCQFIPHPAVLIVGHAQKCFECQRFTVRAGQEIAGGEFVAGEIAFQFEGGDLHNVS